jgi:hypothetical protein
LSQIQNRSGDRKAAVEMAFEDGLGGRADVKRLFRHLQRIRAAKAEPAELERVVSLCRQVAESLEPSERAKEKTQAADLQKHAIRSVQEAAGTREALGGDDDDDPTEARKRQRGQSYSHGMGF